MTQHVLEFFLSQAWAMEPGHHGRMMQVLLRHADGIKLSAEEIDAATGKSAPEPRQALRVEKGVATIPIHGVIAHRASSVGRISSRAGTSVEGIRADLREALENPDVQAIVLDVDSPGGSVAGIDDLAAEIRAARDVKPIVAHTESLMASAAYWLASQATKITATRSATVGSIGVIASFLDTHRAMANQGLDPVVIKSTPAKGGQQSNGTLSDADRADIQREVDDFHALFVESVAAGRGISAQAADELGDGRVYVGSKAKERGLVDEIATSKSAVRDARRMARELAAHVPAGDVAAGAPSDVQEDPDMTQKTESAADKDQAAKPDTAPDPKTTKAAIEIAQKEAEANERKRVAAIIEAADPEQQAIAAKLVADGKPLDEAFSALTKDRRERLAPPKQEPQGAGNTADTLKATSADRIKAMPEGAAKWKAEFEASPDLQAEFGDVDTYSGWKRNEANLAASKR